MRRSTSKRLGLTTGAFVISIAILGCGGSSATSGGSDGGTGTAGGGGTASTSHGPGSGAGAPSGGGGTGGTTGSSSGGGGASSSGASGSTGSTGTGGGGDNLPPAGNPDGHCAIPDDAKPEDVSHPTTVVGNGTKASCTSDAFVNAVAKGGVITFSCGPDPITITLDKTAKIFNDKGPKIVIDGGGKVTLSGNAQHRILYQDTCDQAQVYTTDHCQNQDTPALTVQNLTFIDGNSTGQDEEGGGGGAIFVRGGRFKVINSRFFKGTCETTGPDLGGAAIRVLSQYNTLPVYIVNSTFGGSADLAGKCSNGGGLSSIGVSYTVINSLFTDNQAIGNGANPAKPGTPGGGSGGAIYNDGDTYTLSLCGVKMTDNHANEGGGAIFFVSNDGSGHLSIHDSTLIHNKSDGFETSGLPGIYVKTNAAPDIQNSTLTP